MKQSIVVQSFGFFVGGCRCRSQKTKYPRRADVFPLIALREHPQTGRYVGFVPPEDDVRDELRAPAEAASS